MSSSPYDVVALDLDGTTVRSDGTVGDRTQAALRRIEALGVTVIAVTGRPPRWMRPVLAALGPDGLAICANGAVVIDLATGGVVSERPIAVPVLRELAGRLRSRIPGSAFAVERTGGGGFVHEPAYPLKWSDDTTQLPDGADLFETPARKLLLRNGNLNADALLAAAAAVVDPATATLTHSSQDGLLEISAAGVTKATTLESVCAAQAVDAARVIAFGDMPNDIPMLTWAGHGVAVRNAHRSLVEVADEVTASNDDEGVADVLDRLWPPTTV